MEARKQEKIAILGCGNMGCSLIEGLIASGYSVDHLCGAELDAERREQLARRYGIRMCEAPEEAAAQARIVLLAVKPAQVQELATRIGAGIGDPSLVVSIAAGIRLDQLQGWVGGQSPVVRAMPNTPAMVRAGITALCAGSNVSQDQRRGAEAVMRSVGTVLWLEDERLMDAVTAVSGSGPAYFFLLMELMEQEAEQLGLEPEQARQLVRQTAFGATKLALRSAQNPELLRRQVSSPGGTTEAAIEVLLEGNIEALIGQALRASQKRSVELSESREES